MSGVRAAGAVLIASAFLVPTAAAWNSKCYQPNGDLCEGNDGLMAPRERWEGVDPVNGIQTEHAELLTYAMDEAALPDSLDEPFVLRRFALEESVTAEWGDYSATHDSWLPVAAGAEVIIQQARTIAEFTMLPDFSYSLWDWAMANEVCAPFPGVDGASCHLYTTHMGALNSSHFLPQARGYYDHYHQLALDRAEECSFIHADVLTDGEPAVNRLRSFIEACEKEALVLEAVGQHYLQDAWSSGHMWERWGGPTEEAFVTDWTVREENYRGVGMAIGAYSGLIHGAKEVVEDLLPGTWDDAMCGPYPGVAAFEADGTYRPMVGDMFWPLLWDDYRPQLAGFMGCMVNGLREVYGATPMLHGEMGTPITGLADLTRDPTGDSCWAQRATNEALDIGFGLHQGTHPNQIKMFGANYSILAMGISFAAAFKAQDALTAGQRNRLRKDSAVTATLIKLSAASPNTSLNTDLASGGLPTLLGVEPNSTYSVSGGVDPDTGEPAMPWVLGDADDDAVHAQALNLVFADSHAPDRCEALTASDLEDLRSRAQAELSAGTAAAAAACGQCAQMAAPHLRVGEAGDYDTDREPLCAYTSSSAEFVYVDPTVASGNLHAAARTWCGCGSVGVLLRGDATHQGLALFDVADETILRRSVAGVADGLLATDDRPYQLDVGGPFGDRAFVSCRGAGTGHLHAFDLAAGAESELDWDDTTEAIDPLPIGANPRGVEALHGLPYVLVATQDAVVFVDAENLSEIARVDTELNLAGAERPWDIEVTPDDTYAYVSLFGTPGTPSNRIVVIDVLNVIDAIGTAVSDEITMGSVNPYWMDLTADGQYLAAALFSFDGVAVIDTFTNAVEDVNGSEPGGFFEADPFFGDSQIPKEVAWLDDGTQLIAGFVGANPSATLHGHGVARRCTTQAEKCHHEVAVEGAAFKSMAVTGPWNERVVVVGDSAGNLTAIPEWRFVPAQNTVGVNGSGNFDGTGGCLDVQGEAEPCPVSYEVGVNISAIVPF